MTSPSSIPTFEDQISDFLKALEDEDLTKAQHLLDTLASHVLQNIPQKDTPQKDTPPQNTPPKNTRQHSLFLYCSALLLVRTHNFARALVILHKAFQPEQAVYEFAETLAIVSSLTGHKADTLYFGKLAPSLPHHPTLKNLLPSWLGTFENALVKSQSFPLQVQYWQQNHLHSQAITHIISLIETHPHEPLYWTCLLSFLFAEERYADAVECAYALQDLRPLSPKDTETLAYSLGKMGRYEDLNNLLSPLASSPLASSPLASLTHTFNLISYLHPSPLLSLPSFLPPKPPPPPKPKPRHPSQPFTIGLISRSWQPFHIASLLAPLFYIPSSSSSAPCKTILLNASSQNTLHLSLLKNRFQHHIDCHINCHTIDPTTLATITHNSGIDLLIDLDGLFSHHNSLIYNPKRRPAPLIASLWDTLPFISPQKGHLILTDTIITPLPSPLPHHHNLLTPPSSLFCIDNQQAITLTPKASPFSIGLIAHPCDLLPSSPLHHLLTLIAHSLPKSRILVLTDTAGGITAIDTMQDFLKDTPLILEASPPHTPLDRFFQETGLVISSPSTLTQKAALHHAVPILHLTSSHPSAFVTTSLLSAFQHASWSFSQPQDLVNLIATWQDNPSLYNQDRNQWYEALQHHTHNAHSLAYESLLSLKDKALSFLSSPPS